MPEINKIEKIFYIASTHWDREWYKSFQKFRFRLVDTLNQVIQELETNSAFSQFMLDGQSVILEDYLEAVPQNTEKIKALLSDKRLTAGPWYTMSDQFLCSGESIIANLLLGHQTAAAFGTSPLKYGYICDIFGHIAQMPQIFRKCGILGALLGRGTNNYELPAHFVWEAPDQSALYAYKVPEECGYGDFWSEVLSPYLSGRDASLENLRTRAFDYVRKESQRSDVPIVVLTDGMDHERIHSITPWLIKELEKEFNCPIELCNLENLPVSLKPYQHLIPVKTGELTQPAKELAEHNKLISGTLSSRYDLKAANDQCQVLWENWALPALALCNIFSHPNQAEWKKIAYRELLKNQAHDSICGCSIDEVHQDMHYRYRQVMDIGTEAAEFSLYELLKLDEQQSGGENLKLTICNPLFQPVQKTVVAEIRFPLSYPYKFDEQIPSEKRNGFEIIDENGTVIPYTLLSIDKNVYRTAPKGMYSEKTDVYRVAFSASLPALGAAEFIVRPTQTPVRYFDSLRTGKLQAENEYIQLKINHNGTISITDKATGKCYDQLLSFTDGGETGDGWFHAAPDSDRIICSDGCEAMIELLHDGPNYCSFGINLNMQVPACMDYNRQYTRRSEHVRALSISSVVVLKAGARYVDVKTTVDNCCVRDHWMKLCLPTGILSEYYCADQPFYFANRPVGRSSLTQNWKEPERLEKAFSNIVYKKEKSGAGFAFLSAGGLHECAAYDDREGTLEITLFRGFSKTFLTDGQSDGQLSKPLTFDYRLAPIDQHTTPAELILLQKEFSAENYAFCCQTKEEIPRSSRSVFSFESKDAAVSLLKTPESKESNTAVVRIVNYSNADAAGILTCPQNVRSVIETDLLENELGKGDFENNQVICKLTAHEIKTYKIIF